MAKSSRNLLPAVASGLLLVALAVLPMVAHALGESYYITLASRVLILAIAAVGLNIALGFGGMVSFGHALYVGVGAYAVAILSDVGIQSGWVQLFAALSAGGVMALLIGLVCLRTSGVAFIMITLAFAQMFYFIVISLKRYGGDDGMQLASRSTFWGRGIEDSTHFYYFIFVALLLVLLAVGMASRSRFGWALRGCRLNARRMAAMGYPVLLYKLCAYVLSAWVCIVAGFLLANLTRLTSPSYLQWSLSGELIVMVVLGGIGTVFGPVLGAICLLLLEELLANMAIPLPMGADGFIRSHWMALIGLFIVVVGMNTRHGIAGLLARKVRP